MATFAIVIPLLGQLASGKLLTSCIHIYMEETGTKSPLDLGVRLHG